MSHLPYGRHSLNEDDVAVVTKILREGKLTQGPMVREFEQAVATYVGAKYAVAVSNGTAALHLAYIALGVGVGDRVLTTPNTFVATANAARFVNAEPDFIDIDEATLNIDHRLLEGRLDKGDVKLVAPVHFAGLPCDMEEISKIAKLSGARVVEDASHALGASYNNGRKVGCCEFSDITVFSFHPVKMIAAGEGGMLTTNSEEIYRELIRLRSHGINKDDDSFLLSEEAYTNGRMNPWYYEMQELGFNYRITDIQCGLALSQLSRLDQFLERRRALVSQYDQALSNVEHVTPAQAVGRDRSAHHLFVVRIDFNSIDKSRQQVMSELLEKGIGTQVHYIPVHRHPYYQKRGFRIGQFPVAESYYEQALSIPLYYELSDKDQNRVIAELQRVVS